MANFTELNDRNQTLHWAPAGLCPSPGHKLWGLKPQSLHAQSQPCVCCCKCPACTGATTPGSPLSSTLPLPSFPICPPLFPPRCISSGPSLPLLFAPLSPSSSFFASLHATPPLLSPLLAIGVVSPRLPFPSTIWTLIPPLLMTSAQVFLAEGVFVHGWWVFFPLPLFFIVGVLFAVVAACLLSALSFLLFFCVAFPSTVFHLPLSTGAVVVGVSGRVVS
jgi:hypothetical protein